MNCSIMTSKNNLVGGREEGRKEKEGGGETMSVKLTHFDEVYQVQGVR